MTTNLESEPHGLLVVDKSRGPTSHDVVAVARRALGTKAVGHTGTLDPMATGVLVLVLGEATKLVNMLSSGDKAYDASVRLGLSTTTWDAEGEVTEQADVPALSLAQVREIAAQFVGDIEQRPPAVSAIKIAGKSLHKRVRAGEQVEAPLRTVRVDALEIHALEGDTLHLSVRCGKGFYVRSLACDLARALGTCGHLSALRRTVNAGFSLAEALGFEALRAAARGTQADRQALRERIVPLRAVCQRLPHRVVDDDLALALRHGRRVSVDALSAGDENSEQGPWIALDRSGMPLSIVACSGGVLRVLRGFCPS